MDTIGALVTHLLATSAVTTLTSTRVYGDELPEYKATDMPLAAVVVRTAGGTASMGGAHKAWSDQSIDLDCYGLTLKACTDLNTVVRRSLSRLNRRRVLVDGRYVLIHWAREISRPVSGRMPDSGWPVCLSTWQVLTAEETS